MQGINQRIDAWLVVQFQLLYLWRNGRAFPNISKSMTDSWGQCRSNVTRSVGLDRLESNRNGRYRRRIETWLELVMRTWLAPLTISEWKQRAASHFFPPTMKLKREKLEATVIRKSIDEPSPIVFKGMLAPVTSKTHKHTHKETHPQKLNQILAMLSKVNSAIKSNCFNLIGNRIIGQSSRNRVETIRNPRL